LIDLGDPLRGDVPPRQAQQRLRSGRDDAIAEMAAAADSRGANAVIGTRFDTRDVSSSWPEICAYGTVVLIAALPGAGTAERAA
jgi:uncharacterized protein YbjQ (UPF0145 family)